MNKFYAIAGAAALAACGSGTAVAATFPTTIATGNYTGTTEFQSIFDPAGLCAANNLVSVGEVQASQGIFALGNTPVVVTPTPDTVGTTTGTPPVTTYAGVGAQVCTYPALPTLLSATGVTQVTGTTNCVATGKPLVRIVTGTPVFGITGTASLNTPDKIGESFKISTTQAALEAFVSPGAGMPPAWTPLCFITTDALFVRSGS